MLFSVTGNCVAAGVLFRVPVIVGLLTSRDYPILILV